ncbi:MAG: phosphoribosylformylglycinamidine synthase subunit PurL, partial [Gaiellaceae bacterium]|nr:phosphoribosylformylglycinamidine synthase subunit PurL [Gaiellaceae bacterium]
NETDGRAIHPTPVVGCVGLLDDVRIVPATWRHGDVVLLAGDARLSLDGSAYQSVYGELAGRPAPLELEAEAALIDFLRRNAPRCSLVHDAADGGLAVALAEAAVSSGIGAELDLPVDPLSLFGEGGGQAVIACAPEVAGELAGTVPLRVLGEVGGDSICGVALTAARSAWEVRGS